MSAETLHSLLYRSTFCHPCDLGELSGIRIEHPLFNATVLLQGAQLISFKPKDETDWLWLSEHYNDHNTFRQGQSVRGGIPICWPWFGDPTRNPKPVLHDIAPSAHACAHGFARNHLWRACDVKESVSSVRLTLALDTATIANTGWRASAHVAVTMTFTHQSVALALTTTNTDRRTLSISQALHTYLPTPDIESTQINGLEGAHFLDCLNDWELQAQFGAINIHAETDRVYRRHGKISVVTPAHTTHINSDHSKSCVVWNPWIDKAKRLSQFDDHAYVNMLCVESANVMDDIITLAPDESATLDMTITRD